MFEFSARSSDFRRHPGVTMGDVARRNFALAHADDIMFGLSGAFGTEAPQWVVVGGSKAGGGAAYAIGFFVMLVVWKWNPGAPN